MLILSEIMYSYIMIMATILATILAHFYNVRINNQRTIGPENAHLKSDLGVLSHNKMTLTLNTHTPLLTS